MTTADHIYLFLSQGTPQHKQLQLILSKEEEQSPADEYCSGIDLTPITTKYPKPTSTSQLTIVV